jgi:predicted transcriptional regulator of viral defense system
MKLDRKYIAQLADQYQGLFKASDLIAAGLSFKQIRQLVTSGDLEKLGQGIYRATSHPYDERVEIARRIPTGVFCLYSACFLHQLSDFVPSEQHLAIPKKSRYVVPAYPPIKLYYWETTAFQLGIGDFSLVEGRIRVYDPEKTVCDMLRLREKVGLDVVKEVVKNYLQRPSRDLAKLHDYARQLHIEKTLHQYLSILL